MFDLFKTTPKPAEPAAAPATNNQPAGTGNINAATPSVNPVQSGGTAPNGVVPDNVNTQESPLDTFKDLWQTDPNAKPPIGDYKPDPIDQTKLQDIMSKVDFSSAVTPENLAAIQQGGEAGAAALINSLNSVAQQTLMQSIMVANKMTATEVQKAVNATKAQIPNLIKDQTTSNNLAEANPLFNNPAVAPMIDMVKSQLTVKYPDASATEITQKAQDYVKAFAESMNPISPPNSQQESNEGTDWNKFLEM